MNYIIIIITQTKKIKVGAGELNFDDVELGTMRSSNDILDDREALLK